MQRPVVVIDVRRAWKLWGALGFVLLMLCGALGYGVSPRDAQGHPRLWTPEVRAVENYRQAVRGWVSAWVELDTHLRAVVEQPTTDLLADSRAAQAAFEAAIQLAQAVEREAVPATLVGLQEQAGATANAYVDASVAVNRWWSAPTPENQTALVAAFTVAQTRLETLQTNAWLQP
jgi:hypothetical protein